MLLIKACPRCSGDLAQSDDHGEQVQSCLQCGFERYGRALALVAETTASPISAHAGSRRRAAA